MASIDVQQYRVKDWFALNGSNKYLVDFSLNKDSTVFEVGGYKGKWSKIIHKKYQPKIYIFEPVKEFYDIIVKKFKGINHVKIYNFGLSNRNYSCKISIQDDASSLNKSSKLNTTVVLEDIYEFIKGNNIEQIDLMNINIEGSEYELLERIIDTELLYRIKNLQIQFHDFVPNAKNRMNQLQRLISKTHMLTYQFEFVWENWKLKEQVNANELLSININKDHILQKVRENNIAHLISYEVKVETLQNNILELKNLINTKEEKINELDSKLRKLSTSHDYSLGQRLLFLPRALKKIFKK